MTTGRKTCVNACSNASRSRSGLYRSRNRASSLIVAGHVATFVLAGWAYALLAMKRYKEVLLANLIAFLVSCAATLALASSHGAVGAAVATVCGETVLAVGSLYTIRYRDAA